MFMRIILIESNRKILSANKSSHLNTPLRAMVQSLSDIKDIGYLEVISKRIFNDGGTLLSQGKEVYMSV